MAGSPVKQAILVLLNNLASKELLDYCRSHKSKFEILYKLKGGLESLAVVVDDAEEQKLTKKRVLSWLRKLEGAVYDTEDLVDEICTEAIQKGLDAEYQTKTSRVGKILSKQDGNFRRIESEMKKLLPKIELFVKQSEELGLGKIIGYNLEEFQRMPAASYFVNDDSEAVFVREAEREFIINLLLSDDASGKRLSVIPIVGRDGIGKTTLAGCIYNDNRISEHFDLRAWINVADPLDIFWAKKAIFKSFTMQSCDLKEPNLLQVRLQECLKGKKFLLVLDDVWDEDSDKWVALLSAFEGAAEGSCVIVTTQALSFAKMICTFPSCYELDPLSNDESWLMFAHFAFRDHTLLEPEDIGRKIAEECGGLPLAVRTVGSLLYFVPEVEEWHSILDRLKHFDRGFKNHYVISFLALGYDYLPAHLKRCFAYCSIFPRGYEFEKEKLVLLWMAEGLVQQPGEEVGDGYFHDLLFRSFFQPSSGNKSRFVMHNLMNDLAKIELKGFCFTLAGHNFSGIRMSTRYLSLLRGKYDSSVIFNTVDKAKSLRNFLPLDHESCQVSSNKLSNLMSKLQFLRVLSLSHYCIDELPNSIGNLKHLRYIDLSHTRIKWLPQSVCALCNLQTLILSNCRALSELPKNTWKLINLRHLDINGTDLSMMPEKMSKLKNLQTLPYFVVGKKSGSTIKELGGLLYLHGALRISMLQNVISVEDAAEAGLVIKEYLDELVLQWVDDTVDEDTAGDLLDKLKPHTNLKRLSIKFYSGAIFPHWLADSSFSNMVFLRLSNCKNCLELPSLGQLPSLKVLTIEQMDAVKRVGREFCGMDKPFQSLEILKFEGMLEWVLFELEGSKFPCLRELCIWRCPKLRNLPKQLPSVQKVEISESQELMNTLKAQASSHKRVLDYQDKVLFITDDEVISFSAKSSFAEAGISLPTTQGATESSSAAAECSLPTTRGASESSSFMTTPDTNDEIDFPTNNWSNEDVMQDGSSVESMKVSEISQLLELPKRLCSLKIEGCEGLEDIPEEAMASIRYLQHLYIINCCSLKSLPEEHPLTSLKLLYIQNCKKLELSLPAKKKYQYALLEHLCIGSSCDSLKSLRLYLFPKLRCLSIWDCKNLESLSMSNRNQKDLTSLEALEIRDCPNLEYFPKGGLPTPNLTSIWLSNCKNLKELPHQLHTLNFLQSNFINNCPELVSFPEGGLPSNLSLLCITSCNQLIFGRDWGLHRLRCLSQLEIEGGCKNLVSFPEEKLLPRNLNSLRISGLLNLEYLDYKGLQHLTALQTLEISCCAKLRSLPEEGLPSSLSVLCIKECSLLKPKLQNKAGNDWSNLAQIARIEIDEEVIRDWSKKS
ncbi:hypothetical protein RGQ29_020743 [Quercus rubra]|uniref:Uncharacterized protein n=1 Tax=Quercus rubra TaxID=3512 RepID=A0AAN7FD30_QUERU|nr:hypothetical protein RGQ29_020743 [Quercus rubra]